MTGKQQQQEGTERETVSRWLPKPIVYDLRTEFKELAQAVEHITLREGVIYYETQQVSQTRVAYNPDILGQPLSRIPEGWIGPAANAPEQDLPPTTTGNMTLLLHQFMLEDEVPTIEPLLKQLVS